MENDIKSSETYEAPSMTIFKFSVADILQQSENKAINQNSTTDGPASDLFSDW